jgi:nucleoside 2-deoxyribosyltransferase
MKIFLAAPFTQMLDGETSRFAVPYREWLEEIIAFLRDAGHEVISAHIRELWGDALQPPSVALANDWAGIRQADVVIAHVGNPPSPGVQMELGIALSLGKRLVVLTSRDAFVPYLNRGLPDVADCIICEVGENGEVAEILASIVEQDRRSAVSDSSDRAAG